MSVQNPSELAKTGGSASLNFAQYTGDQTGQASVDCLGFEYALVVIVTGTVAAAGITINIASSSDDGSSDAFFNVSGASHAIPAADDNKVVLGSIRLSHKERYLRADADEATSGGDATVGVFIIPFASRASATYTLGTYAFDVI